MKLQEKKIIGEKQPNSRDCFICGLENPVGLRLKIYITEPGVIQATYTAPDHFQGYPGILHGGITAALLDEMSGRAHMDDPSDTRFMFSARIEVKYRRTVPLGIPLTIIGKAGKSVGKKADAWAGIYDPEDTLLAEANAILIDMPDGAISMDGLEALGWKVYPD
ncbi:MAG: PaaI family thioesterase [Anaerolineae bacterium]|nr:PaaI family thioesterase [Anaerolineae bacterium]MDK1080952.1 PaaI family thioesterase [Anaerolineae bacterium]MDK1117872.1 PaaI family thioesterase [Anaerolineae bacterium]